MNRQQHDELLTASHIPLPARDVRAGAMKNNAPEWARPEQQSPLSYLWKNPLLNNKKIIQEMSSTFLGFRYFC
ncbi:MULTISPECIES: hypothetical protein [unclassified Burkholderia]|uniref:hypothetical protein n=1 Tax=unclassified Burkholderia TaxID=2613784 RepID=UPI00141FFE0A|nr:MULTISPECIES: hypothetical protein [unclassified Burkholderia]NIE84701.1 hypothetical protein [Burkholderia sp. Tr-860]NIF63388.1 hypothetical protein [Burkholderia sp. Cy-647]NIF98638.1 hypothetical protein [Burkholderia sp. Ax-1720]